MLVVDLTWSVIYMIDSVSSASCQLSSEDRAFFSSSCYCLASNPDPLEPLSFALSEDVALSSSTSYDEGWLLESCALPLLLCSTDVANPPLTPGLVMLRASPFEFTERLVANSCPLSLNTRYLESLDFCWGFEAVADYYFWAFTGSVGCTFGLIASSAFCLAASCFFVIGSSPSFYSSSPSFLLPYPSSLM